MVGVVTLWEVLYVLVIMDMIFPLMESLVKV